MPIAKTTDTVAGEANTALLAFSQYGIRAKIEVPNKKAIAATHRASSSTTRTITLAENHEMAVNDLFLFGNFGHANYNPTTTFQIGVVSAVPAPNKLSFVSFASLNETETEDTAGGIIRLGFRRLRLGVRWAVPRTSAWSIPAQAMGFGLAQGIYPVSSVNCASFFGYCPHANGGTMTYFATSPASLAGSSTVHHCIRKAGDTWATETFLDNNADACAASRATPFVHFFELSATGGACRAAFAIAKTTTNTQAKMLSGLRSLAALPTVGAIGDLTIHTGGIGTVSSGNAWAKYAHGLDLYLEAFIRDPTQGVEIMDIGYSVLTA